jgi:hypothetical protein
MSLSQIFVDHQLTTRSAILISLVSFWDDFLHKGLSLPFSIYEYFAVYVLYKANNLALLWEVELFYSLSSCYSALITSFPIEN